jgi:hypothetical protein
MTTGEILSHPLFLLIIGAIISGLLIPILTRKWQKDRTDLEIKIDLVSRISETVMKMMTAIDFVDAEIRKELEEAEKLRKAVIKKSDIIYRDDPPKKKESFEHKNEKLQKFEEEIKKQFGELNTQYKKFRISSAVLGTQIESYFPNTDMKKNGTDLLSTSSHSLTTLNNTIT